MASNRRKYFRKNRKALRREQKPSLNGILSAIFGWIAAGAFAASVIRSFQESGGSGWLVGTAGLIGLVFAVGAIWIGGYALRKEQKIRKMPPKMGIALGVIFTIVYCALYLYGFLKS